MIDALIGGALAGAPVEKVSGGGKTYVQAKLRVPVADGESLFVLVSAFDPEVRRALLAHASGDSIAISGAVRLSTWTPPQGGEARVNVSMVAHAVISAYAAKRKRAAMQGGQRDPAHTNGSPAPQRTGQPFHDDDL
ncbi:single-stranded DNA-binding protein [Paraburkholderia youngii]|uniref:single-stranded DNA-binding protein n=1 Tax=Paraburkholderia youngii TaxID=2782701 RepID=UPI003D21910B